MRTLDLDMVRQQIAEFTSGGKTFEVFEPTIGQRLQHSAELKRTQEDHKKLLARKVAPSTEEVDAFLNKWYLRELQIFIPLFTKDDLIKIDHAQRAKIFELIFGIEPTESGVQDEKKTSQGRKKGESRGGRS